MTKDEEQLIANIMHRMHANEQARLDAALSSARADAVTRAEADRVRIDALAEELLQEREAHAETADILNKTSAQLREAVVQKESDLIEAAHKTAKVLQHREGESLLFTARRVVEERDGLMTQVQDLRVALRKEQEAHDGLKQALGIQAAKEAGKVLGMANGEGLRSAAKRVIKERDDMRAALAKEQELHAATALRLSTEAAKLVERKHPVKVGAWVRRTDDECGGIYFGRGVIAQVLDVLDAPEHQYTVSRPEWNGYTVPWAMQYCEPCDPPTEATHDTPEGKDVAESVIRDDRNTEPADDIKNGDIVEVISSLGPHTYTTDIAARGIVEAISDGGGYIDLAAVNGFRAVYGGRVSLCDVRKVTT